jgi:outer membrane receptor protein involved in Fe transport
MKVSVRPLIFSIFLIAWFAVSLFGQTTGKISGIVVDKETKEPIPGANIFIEGTSYGAATDLDGYFNIINVVPGLYTVSFQMIGYADYQVKDLRVSVNRTTSVQAQLSSTILEGETVVVEADKMGAKKDQTSTIRNISSDEMRILPVETLESVVNLQAGVVNGHFRGGRKNEVAYLIDGMQVVEAFGGENSVVSVEPEVVEDLEIITGTFNAEYGRAMSGIVNAVTKDGGNQFHGAASAHLGNYVTEHGDIFIGLDNSELDREKDYRFQLSGPIFKDVLTFFFNARSQDLNGYLNGIHRFNVDDYSDFASDNPDDWETYNTGDSSSVPIGYSKLASYMAKVTLRPFNTMRASFLFTRNDDEWRSYDHQFKYNPYGLATNHQEAEMYALLLNHMLSNKLFYDIKLSYVDNFYGWYVFEDPEDDRYVHESYFNNNGPGFYTGGQQKGHTQQTMKDYNVKIDVTWQINQQHLLKTGALFTQHDLYNEWHDIQNWYQTQTEDQDAWYIDPIQQKRIYPNYKADTLSNESIYTDIYEVKPFEFSYYIQDKMEFEDMVLNLGVRLDYFKPNTSYPSQRRNPANQLSFPDSSEKMSSYIDTDPQYQISPRLGLSYQLGQRAVLHFSYGHFFQMPPMYALFQNNSFQVAPNDYVTTMGNSQLEAQKTIQYELGLWQELMDGMGLEVVVYYRDIYNLLSTKIVSTYNQIQYGLYTNKDYGNVKGLEISFDFLTGNFTSNLNYTLQYTRGNSDNPTQTFNREGDSRDPVPTLIPMSWDQRHTLNVTVGYNTPLFGITAIGYYSSGTPYTWTPISENRVANINLYPNNSYQPSINGVDLRAYYNFLQWNDIRLRLELFVYNLFDQLNESWVDATTGRAYTSIIRDSDLSAHHSNFNEYTDRIHNPSMFNAPRLIKLGLGVQF